MQTRTSESTLATIASGAAVSGAIDMSAYNGLGIIMPAAWTAATVGFQVCGTIGGTYVPLEDTAGDPVTLTVEVSKAYTAPSDIAPWRYVKVWSHTAGSDTNQGAARSIVVQLKA